MFAPIFNRLKLPRTLRSQFTLALVLLELLIIAGSIMAVYALRVSATATRQLAEERLVRMQDAEDLMQRAVLIENETDRMLSAGTRDEMLAHYDNVIKQLGDVDRLVDYLGKASADVSVLALQQSGQLFRNTANVVAELREKELKAGTNDATAPDIATHNALRRFLGQLHEQATAMVASSQELSARFTSDYRVAVRRVADMSINNQRWLLVLVISNLILAWLLSRYFLQQQVLDRLQVVSNSLRQNHAGNERPKVPVQGNDEIAEMARAVEQFLEDRQRLAEANKELESFSYTISHDLRAPLRSIGGFARILSEEHKTSLDAEAQGFLNGIHRNTIRMGNLIDDILEFSRMARRELNRKAVNMATLTREIFEEIRGAEPARNIVLHLNDLPPANGDENLIRQVLVNLLSNAVKFTAERPEAVIEVSCIPAGDENTYCIKDNGVGFDMQYVGKLFGVFQRLTSDEKFKGTGIGLAIVKRIVNRHGGRVWAESKPGEGASFYFTLPVV